MTLSDLIKSTCWTKPEDHIRISLFDRDTYIDNDELEAFTPIPLTVRNIAIYGNYEVKELDVERDSNGGMLFLSGIIEV